MIVHTNTQTLADFRITTHVSIDCVGVNGCASFCSVVVPSHWLVPLVNWLWSITLEYSIAGNPHFVALYVALVVAPPRVVEYCLIMSLLVG